MVVAMFGASFAKEVWHLVFTQGVLYAIGGALMYFTTCAFLDEWFIRRKGFAFGVMWAGAGGTYPLNRSILILLTLAAVSGTCIPFVMTWGLGRYSSSIMLRAWAVVMVCVSGPLLFFIKPRLPVYHPAGRRTLSLTFLKTSTFWIYQLGNIIESFGFFVPGIYLPSYARTIGLSTISGTVAVALFNAMSVLGAVLLGHIT